MILFQGYINQLILGFSFIFLRSLLKLFHFIMVINMPLFLLPIHKVSLLPLRMGTVMYDMRSGKKNWPSRSVLASYTHRNPISCAD